MVRRGRQVVTLAPRSRRPWRLGSPSESLTIKADKKTVLARQNFK